MNISIIKKRIAYYRIAIIAHIYPKYLANMVYRSIFRKDIAWDDPQDLIEKIYWLQLNTNTSLWTKCADKYRVREFIKSRKCEAILNTLYGMWEKADDIDFDSLPDSFVLKTNNSCGQIIIVKDKSKLNIEDTKRKLNQWLKYVYGYYGAQLHYTRIKPCIIAEKLLTNSHDSEKSLIDYKIWCFNGQPECILVASNRSKSSVNENGGYTLSMYDTNWNNISERALNKNNVHYGGNDIKKPESLEKMLEYAMLLSKGFPEVRVDFYEIDDKPIFGEMTFTTGYGSYAREFYQYLGSKIELSKINRDSHLQCYE